MEKETKILRFFLMLVCAIFGIVDASAIAADAAAAAAAGAEAVNGTGQSKATTGQDGVGVHTSPLANAGEVTDTMRQASPDFVMDPVDEKITKMFQSGVPIDQIMRMLPTSQKNGMRYSHYSVDTLPINAKVTAAFTEVQATVGVGTLKVDNPNMFNPTDTIVVPSILGYDFNSSTRSKTDPLRLYVQSVSTEGLTVLAINGGLSSGKMSIPYIPADTPIIRLARAASEGEVQTAPYFVIPEKDELYMQIFKTQVAQSTIAKVSDKEVNWDLTDQEELALYDMRRSIELAFLYGAKGYFFNSATKRWVYSCSGIIQQILERGTVIKYDPESLTEAKLMTDIVKPIYLGNSGSSTRYLFAGSDFVTNVATLAGIQKQMNATQVTRKFGYDWKTIQFMSWQLNLYQHPLLDEIGLSQCAIVLDLQYVRKNYFRTLTKDALDLKSSGAFDGDSNVWTEISSIELKYPKCHAFIMTEEQFNPTAATAGVGG